MTPPGHEMILASAGSGKTYALTNRIVRLLALGAAPERIVALTFTRKAAGEFFDVILRKLADAAADPARARDLAREIACPGIDAAGFLGLLRAMVEAMPRLSLGTFDAFFARIVRSVPLELGLAGDFELLQEHATLIQRRRVLRRMFSRAASTHGPDEAQRAFIEAFKQATYGAEQKKIEPLLASFLDRHQEVYLAVPDGDYWGNPRRIWPGGCPWPLETGPRELAAAVAQLQARVDARTDLPDKQRARLGLFLADLADWSPPSPLPESARTPLKNALAAWPALLAGEGVVTVEAKKLTFAGADAAALVDLVRAIIGAEMHRRLQITRGLHAVLANYEQVYHQLVRRAGQLTFADIQRLLAPDSGAPALAFGHQDAGDADAEEDRAMRRLAIDWRLDGRFDHWLLDEFQDTSHAQWCVLRNLIDEVVQDASGQRTFFYVGDAKQAIYAWREGDARLMREIFDHYGQGAASGIQESFLDKSYRSAPPLLAMVNRVFSAQGVFARHFPAAAAARWAREWREHTPAKPQLTGHAAWIHAPEDDDRFRLALRILLEIRPTERGLTSAVLVQKNETAARLADFLRREGGLPAVAEADLHVCIDNPLSAALLALLKAAAHPGDTLAWEHVSMTPLHAVLESRSLAGLDAAARHVLAQVHGHGFEHTVTTWLEWLEPHLAPDDAFSRTRSRQMAEAARLFDETGGRDVAEFIQFMERHTVREPESAAVVRVMTIHKSKGLGFDIVLLPDLEGRSIDVRREGLAVKRARDRSVEWVFDLPSALFLERDERLAAHVEAAEADACYDKLALLYVAMTRAKRGLYVITKPAGTSTSRNFPRILTDTLGGEAAPVAIGRLGLAGPFSAGDGAWFVDTPAATPPPPPAPLPFVDPRSAAPAPRRPALAPSRRADGTLAGATLFTATRDRDAAAYGSAVHAILASIDWWDESHADARIAAWRAAGHAEDAITEAVACLRSPDTRGVFTASPDVTGLWRERAFEIILEGAWVTGVFDRVIVRGNRGGGTAHVEVYDFKTDRILPSVDPSRELLARYTSQMGFYRRAAATLAGVAPDAVLCSLVPTSAGLPPVVVPP